MPATRISPPTPDARLQVIAYLAAALAVVAAVGAVLIHRSVAGSANVEPIYVGNLVVGAGWPLAGAAVLRAQPRNRVGWLLLATSLLAFYELLSQYSLYNARVSELPGAAFTDWVSMFGFGVYFFVLPLLPLLFPDGTLAAPGWRWLVRAVVLAGSCAVVARMFTDERSDTDAAIRNPLGIEGAHWLNWIVAFGSYACIAILTPIALVSLVRRTRRAVGVERAQLQWLQLGGVVLVAGILGSQLFRSDTRLADLVFALGLVGPPICVVVAMLRHRLFDVEFALSRTLVLLVVIGVVGGGWSAVVLGLDPGVIGTRSGFVVVGLLALAAVLLRDALQRVIDRRWFPHRLGAETLAPRISRAVSLSAEPREALAELVTALRGELGLPYAGFRGVVSASDGARPEHSEQLVATAMGRDTGLLEVAPRRSGEGFTRQERRLLEQVAAQAAMIAYAASLVADVEDSRAGIVRAREEERRRLRNDLHDGVGPGLAGIALQIDALATRLEQGGEISVAQEARMIRDRVRDAVADVRAVSHGLRPPVLDQIGLSASLRQLVDGIPNIHGTARVDELHGISAAAEVAAYSVAAEAVANVVRHSAASIVRLEAEQSGETVTVRVADNGRGMPSRPQAGVGLTSMRQRAAEVGGRVEHLEAPGGGTLVRLVLPTAHVPTSREVVRP